MSTAASSAEELVDHVRAEPARREDLLPLLHEAHPAYDGLGESSAVRLRGWVMACFGEVGLPAAAVAAVVEVLRTAQDAFAVAAAARAARGSVAPPPELAQALVAALLQFRDSDDTVTFDALRPQWPVKTSTTALTEVAETLREMGSSAHAVHDELVRVQHDHAATWSPGVRRSVAAAVVSTSRPALSLSEIPQFSLPTESPVPATSDVRRLVLEDQSGGRSSFEEHFSGRHHFVAFFYTRCGNPRRCSATVTRLAALQDRIEEAGLGDRVGIAAISYDSGYDLPHRLAAYGSARGMRFTPTVRMFRVPSGYPVLRNHFDLQVGYAGSLVNQHAIELYLLDERADLAHTWSRVEWSVDEVFEAGVRLAG